MVTKDGLVKILDFGLAKLTRVGDGGEETNLPTETGTGAGVVLGGGSSVVYSYQRYSSQLFLLEGLR